MNRRVFLQRTALAGAGISLLPGALMASWDPTVAASTIDLSGTMVHVRHGLFQMGNTSLPGWPTWLTRFQLDRFLADGHSEQAEDLYHMTVQLGQEGVTTIGWDGTKCWVGTDGEMKTLELTETLSPVNTFANGFEVSGMITRPKTSVVFPEKVPAGLAISPGQLVTINGQQIGGGEGLLLDGLHKLTIESQDSGPIFLLSKTTRYENC